MSIRGDSITKEKYERMYQMLPSSKSILPLFRERSFMDVYLLMATTVLNGGGLNTQTAETHLTLMFVDLIFGLPEDTPSVMGLPQVGFKKLALGINEIAEKLSDFVGVADDIHVRRTFGWFVLGEGLGDTDMVRHIRMFCRKISPLVGWWANEILGQLGQLLKGDDRQYAFAEKVYKKMATKYTEGEYDGLIDNLMGKDFCRVARGQRARKAKKEKRKRRKGVNYKPKLPPVNRRTSRRGRTVRKREREPEIEREYTELNPYEKSRAERIARNNARLMSLGFPIT